MSWLVCLQIESSFQDDDLIYPKKGECKLEFDQKQQFLTIYLKKRNENICFDKTNTTSITTHIVSKLLNLTRSIKKIY